jgi:hypothetical protein
MDWFEIFSQRSTIAQTKNHDQSQAYFYTGAGVLGESPQLQKAPARSGLKHFKNVFFLRKQCDPLREILSR